MCMMVNAVKLESANGGKIHVPCFPHHSDEKVAAVKALVDEHGYTEE